MKEIKRSNIIGKPHVVLLGAGASIAALPKGDKHGRYLPNLQNIAIKLGLIDLIEKYNLERFSENFESLYSYIYDKEIYDELKNQIEDCVLKYFRDIVPNDKPNIYDYLLFSLRPKDIIATFNWDPLLMNSYRRNYYYKKYFPQIVFLHGNVCLQYCEKDDIICPFHEFCPKCSAKTETLPLLFPVERKDYNNNKIIKEAWKNLTHHLEHNYIFTIFGYSAPKTDIEARTLLKNAWNENNYKQYSDTEIIDIKRKSEIEKNWEEFIFSHHYSVLKKINNSYSFSYPRRSCESLFARTMMLKYWPENRFPRFQKLESLYKWISPLLEDEDKVQNSHDKNFRYKSIIYNK